jgi:hypothetical protein
MPVRYSSARTNVGHKKKVANTAEQQAVMNTIRSNEPGIRQMFMMVPQQMESQMKKQESVY